MQINLKLQKLDQLFLSTFQNLRNTSVKVAVSDSNSIYDILPIGLRPLSTSSTTKQVAFTAPPSGGFGMSAEIENGKEDGGDAAGKGETQQRDVDRERKGMREMILDYWQIGMKILELLLCAVSVGLVYDPTKNTRLGQPHMHHIAIVFTTFCGQIMIILVQLVSRLFGDHMPFKTSTLFSVAGAVMHIVTGTILVADRAILGRNYFFHPQGYLMEMLTIATVVAFANGVVFVVDAVLTFRRQQDF